MAITKIHAIKATVKGAINYICNPDKTDGQMLISSYGTTPASAADDFRFIMSHREDPGYEVQAYHLIQSFKPDEVTAEEAHIIGTELADRLLKGRYSYVISTHNDKGHIHNHLVFCACDNIEYKKYDDSRRTYWNIRHINDEICAEHNLSVLRDNNHLSKSYKEWSEGRRGTSWKSQLRANINETIKQSHTYEEFLSLMQAKGYEIKDSGFSENDHKYIGFRAPGQERWVRGRAKSLGNDFTKEKIRERIEEKARIRTERMQRMYNRTGRMIDISEERYTQSPWLKQWADRQNLKEAARVQSRLAKIGIQSIRELDEKIEALTLQAKTGKSTTVSLDKEIKQAAEILRYARQYSETHKYEKAYDKSKDPDRYYRMHHIQIQQSIGARSVLNSYGLDADRINVNELEADYLRLLGDRAASLDTYKTTEKECAKLQRMKDELSSFMGVDQPRDIDNLYFVSFFSGDQYLL
ncbi:MAG: relaxase/mobilization nuclease domain-containing protein [Lachnospiraceae bacterium]|nr:relaxase/mobilization nuclease domain-containing protein [Lachnospiraceae bacterium]